MKTTIETITTQDVKRAKRLNWEMQMMILQAQADKASRDKRMAEFERQKAEVENMRPKKLWKGPDSGQRLEKGYPLA